MTRKASVLFPLFFLLQVFLTAELILAAPHQPEEVLGELKKTVRLYRLANGLRVLIRKRGHAPVFSGLITVRVGGVNERIGQTGVSHLLEHMAFKGTDRVGTKDYAREKELLIEQEKLRFILDTEGKLSVSEKDRLNQIDQELRKLWKVTEWDWEYRKRGATGINASTGKELTRYYASLPKNALEFWCRMEAERIANPVFRQFYRERNVVMEERRMRSEDAPEGRLYEKLLETAFNQHPYRLPVVGYAADLQRLTPSMLWDFHHKYYVPGNMVVTIVGDVDPDQAIRSVKEYFGKLPASDLLPSQQVEEPGQMTERRVSTEAVAAAPVFIGYHKPVYPHPDSAPLALLSEVLAGSRIAPLYRELVRSKRLAAEVYAYSVPGRASSNLLLFGADLQDPDAIDEYLAAFDQVIEDFKKGGPSLPQLEMAKKQVIRSYLGNLESNLAQAKTIAMAELLYGNWQVIFDWYKSALNVTARDLNRVARKYLVTQSRTVAFAAKKEK